MSKRTLTCFIRMMPVVLALILWISMSGVALADGQDGSDTSSGATSQTPTETIPQSCPGQQTDPTVIQQLESYLSGLLQLFGMTATYECVEPAPTDASTSSSATNATSSTGSTNPAATTAPTSTESSSTSSTSSTSASTTGSTSTTPTTSSQVPTTPPTCTPVDAATATQIQTYISQILQLFGLTAEYQQVPCQ